MPVAILEKQTVSPSQDLNGNGRIPFMQLLDQYEFPQPQRGDILQGEILRIEQDILYVDVGSKRDAIVPYAEVGTLDEAFLDNLSRGDEVPVYVTRTPEGDEHLLVSLERGLQILDWERAEKLEPAGEILELKVVNYNKGGLVVEFGRLQGFVPNSHLPAICHNQDQTERQSYKAQQIDKTLPLKIIEVDQAQERFVLSGTAVQKEQQQQLLHSLAEGDIVTGQVVNIKKYGAFVDIGHGLTGLLHISKISWDQIDHPSDVLTVGEEVDLLVEDIELDRGRISLNRKVLLSGPWQQFTASHNEGDLAAGEVTAVIEYGAFVKLPEGVEGLLHQNEMILRQEAAPADVLQAGDTVLVRLLNIDPDRQRLSLSMRQVSASEELEWMSDSVVESGE